jgi:hypothetical protein
VPDNDEFVEVAQYRLIDGQFMNVETAELIHKEDLRKSVEKQQLEDFYNAHATLNSLGISSNLRLVRTRSGSKHLCVKVKEKHTFNKVFRVDMRWLLENVDLTEREQLFLFRFENYLHFPSNSVLVKGSHPTIEEMATMMNIKSDKVVRNTINSLEEKDIIKTEQIGNRRVIYFNPFLISTGGIIEVETYSKFENSKFNPDSPDYIRGSEGVNK